MLQIITGKFFTTDELIITKHRGILYTNYGPVVPDIITTPIGRLLPASTWSDVSGKGIAHLIYEIDEKLEAVRPDGTKEFMASVGGDYLIQDFSAVISFALNITSNPDIDLVRRLTQSKHASLGVSFLPYKYIGRTFDERIEYRQGEEAKLTEFIEKLFALKRDKYRAVMRAIRRYTTGLYRLADDQDLAYVLLVASMESLAQKFDDFMPTWQDYPNQKRTAIDNALDGIDEEVKRKVRDTLLEHEHISLANRYREFVKDNITSAFYREEALHTGKPVRQSDLSIALGQAYTIRSGYIHTLQEIPRQLTSFPFQNDILFINGKPTLTFHGLARTARHVIHTFIERAEKVNLENFDYRKELPNLVQMPLAERYWLANANHYTCQSANRYLSGFLSELSRALVEPKNCLTILDKVLAKIEKIYDNIGSDSQRLPLFTLYILYHKYIKKKNHRPQWESFVAAREKICTSPSIESLLIHVLLNIQVEWPLEDVEELFSGYLKQRYHKGGLNISPLFEAAIALYLAEICRINDDLNKYHKWLSYAVENLPGDSQLYDFEMQISKSQMREISWSKILLRPTIDINIKAVAPV